MDFIDSTALSTALPTLAHAFHSDPIHLKLCLTSYIMALAVFTPASGWVADRYGAKRVFLLAMSIFLTGSIACALSRTLPQLVAARILQGAGGAMMTPVGRLIVVGSAPRERLVSAMAAFSMPALVGPMIGPPLAGLVLTFADWPWIFLINLPVGIAGMFAVSAFAPKLEVPHPGPFDWRGFALSAIAIVYTSLVAFRQTDMKKLIAYSSVAHMGFVTMGIFAGTLQGAQGAVFQMLSHGVISGALFLCVGVIYDRMHTREIAFYGGLADKMPWYAATFLLFTMGNVGLPGTSGFVGEILTMTGVYGSTNSAGTWTALVSATGVILSAVYALTLYKKVMFGHITNPKLGGILDLDTREVAIFTPLIISALALGVYPHLVFSYTDASVANLVTLWRAAVGG